ncbi:MAG TPA: DUF362 domain-containing protein, partial [Spirochaetia bacterium]|nr:DUF362 domain-containing protein [Spirochaetia bacterium]
RLDLPRHIGAGEYVAVKMHLGSQGAFRVIRPVFLRKLVEAIREAGGRPFITDTVRIPGLEYLEVAKTNGINELSTGAPVVLADGIFGRDLVMVESGPILGEIGVASAIHDAPVMVVLSHCKGHIGSGYGGAIKNLGMGGLAFRDRNGVPQRGRIHFLQNAELTWDGGKCSHCRQCVDVCPHGTIVFTDDILVIDKKECARCGRCSRVCPEGALVLPQNDEVFQGCLAESARAVLSTFTDNKVLYINFLTEIQAECDCMPISDTPVVPDIGILASTDIVAIEQASLDLVSRAQVITDSRAGDKNITCAENIFKAINGHDPYLQVRAAAALGLGSPDYELVPVTHKPKPDGSGPANPFEH